ncbi:MAG: aromatic-ring-hydroxylating dioxygenase subunit beta [Pseudomonadota bacterium]|nr:aromatic-ring-hydroxylating dioxygenase subunit beta [Pseudomonadota bacterium]
MSPAAGANAEAPRGIGRPVDDSTYRAVCEFLYSEAELLASRDYRRWLELLAPDLSYRIPLQQFDKRGEERRYGDDPAWFDETRDSLCIRVEQLLHPQSNADRVPSFLRYLVTNILARETPDGLAVSSQVLLIRMRANNPQPFLLSGARQDLLRSSAAGLQLARREVRLDMPLIDSPNLAFFL